VKHQIEWPGGAACAALITVNFNAERTIVASNPEYADLEKTLSTSAYGVKHGVDNLLQAFEQAGVKTSWFVPGIVAAAHGELIQKVAEEHEVGTSGWDFEPLAGLDRASIADRLSRTIETFNGLGITPRGFRLPRGEWQQGLVEEMLAAGIEWSSSWEADDLPFLLPGVDGTLVELPFRWVLEDRQAFIWNYSPAMPPGHSRIASYADVLESWLEELRGTHAEGGLWTLTVNPDIIGTPGRIGLLVKVLEELRSLPDVWIPTGSELADWWRSNGPANSQYHPVEVFLRETEWTSL